MDRSELNEKAKKYISDAGFGTGTNITLHGAKCLMVDFYLDNQVKNNVGLANASKSFYCETKRGCLEQCDECALTELAKHMAC